jgi:hypothetical protein
MGFGETIKRVQAEPSYNRSRSGIAMLGEAGVKVPITAPNAIATATASAIMDD